LELYAECVRERVEEKTRERAFELFRAELDRRGFADLALRQAAYATGLASHASALLQEEMLKLFHLADEVYALSQMGCPLGADAEADLARALRGRFERDPVGARYAASSAVSHWNGGLWWYVEGLS
jgi:hypothetical protein